MRARFGRVLFATGLLVLLGSFALAGDVKTDWDHNADFKAFHTYSWKAVKTSDPLWESRVKDAVDKQLQGKGWQLLPEGGDVVLAAVSGTKDKQEYNTFYSGMGPGWYSGGFGSATAQTTVTNYKVGTLVVDIYNGQSHQLLWRGVATDTMSDKSEKNQEKLDKAVKKMFEKFPPEEKGK